MHCKEAYRSEKMKSNNYNISEEDFLKNKARRKASAQKNSVKKKKKKKPSKNPALKGFLIALGVLAGIVILAIAVAAIYYFSVVYGDAPDNHNDTNDNFINAEGNEVIRETSDNGKKKYYTFLATATDKGGALTDVIMVARFNYDEKNPDVSILQIPRDTYVKISTDKLYFTKDGALSSDNFTSPSATTSLKINEAFYRGKLLAESTVDELLDAIDKKTDAEIEKKLKEKKYLFLEVDEKKAKNYAKANKSEQDSIKNDILRDFGLTYLQNLIYYDFGIPTDYRAQVNINGFRGIVNAIDGVDLYISRPMHYDDPYQDLHIHFDPGQHHLNGKKAEEFVRFRGYPEGDVARLDAQKLFINAFLDKLLSFSTVSKIDEIATEVKKNLYTDVSFNNMLKFANKLLSMDLKSDVHTYTLPGQGEYIGPVSYFVADRDEVIKLVNEKFNVFNSPLIDEDFKMIDNDAIYRPAVSITDDASSDETEDENDGDDSDNTDDSEEDSDKVDGEEDEDDTKDEISEDNEDNESENGAKEDSSKDKDVDKNSDKKPENNKAEDSQKDNKLENTDEVSISETDTTDSQNNTAVNPEQDENYQLLLDMAA